MHRSRIIARCCPVLLVVVGAACASRGSTTNVNSPGDVALEPAATRTDTAARVDTTTRVDTMTRRDTTVRADTTAATPPAPAAATAAAVELMVADAPGVGSYVTDATGRAVYIIETTDSAAVDCTGACATELDPVVGHATVASSATGLEASALGMRPLPDGRHQVTYNGKPLYFSRADAAKGDTKGQGTKSYGNVRLLTPKK
jgi:predicted lipoprotein with Yx(FWY)xxD motif